MDILFEWLGYIGRWSHVLAAITWIGTSFYFNWLDLSERRPQGPTLKPNVEGALHEMHGGSFYYHERYWPTEDNPRTLAHSGPAQLTFLTGVFLIIHIYWLGADAYLVKGAGSLSTPLAIVASALLLTIPWLLYHRLVMVCRNERVILACVAALVLGLGFIAGQLFSPRAAIVHVGAALGTIMALNVHFVIIPNHIRMRKQVKAGEAVDLTYHQLAKRRSQHNNYLTLPVLFAMLSVHFPLATGTRFAWLLTFLIMGAGFLLRYHRNIQLSTDRKRPELRVLALLMLIGAIALSFVPAPRETQDVAALSPEDAAAFQIVETRCTVCHSAAPEVPDFGSPPAGVRLETLDQIRALKSQILTVAVDSDLMPPGNWTEITEQERAQLGHWLKTLGAPRDE